MMQLKLRKTVVTTACRSKAPVFTFKFMCSRAEEAAKRGFKEANTPAGSARL